jgi:hypothetical protein
VKEGRVTASMDLTEESVARRTRSVGGVMKKFNDLSEYEILA